MAQDQPSMSDLANRMDRLDGRMDRLEQAMSEIQELLQPTEDESKIEEVLEILQGLSKRSTDHENRLSEAIKLIEQERAQLTRIERGNRKSRKEGEFSEATSEPSGAQ